MPSFFPDPVFGWTFYAVLVGFLLVSAWSDVRSTHIPNLLTVSMLGVGLLFNLARGIWLGAVKADAADGVWVLPGGAFYGALDALLFALSGFALCFVLFYLLWLFGMAGGGDVKMFAALGAWVGPKWVLFLIIGTMIVFVGIVLVMMVRKIFRRGVRKTAFAMTGSAAMPDDNKKSKKPIPAGAKRRDKLVAYSLPTVIATALIVPFLPAVRADLHLPTPNPASAAPQQSPAQQ